MPSMKLFGRRWAVSSDDFVFPAISEGLLRFSWFIITLCVYALHPDDICPAAGRLNSYIIVALVLNAVIILLSFSTAFVSSRGTIRNPVPRRRLPDLLYVRFAAVLFELVWNIVGLVWLCRPSELAQCEPAVVAAGRLTLISSWLMIGVFAVGFWFVFDPLGNVRHDDVKLTDQAKRLWKWRLHLLCCCASGSDRAKVAFEDVAELLASYFGDTDLVLTDVLAGIILLANKDLTVLNLRDGAGVQQSPDSVVEDTESAVPAWMNLHLASRMMEFALGVYGWPYYVCAHGCALQPLWKLLHKLRCCTQCRCDNVIVIKDNCCQCNTAALLLHTEISEADIFHVNLHNEIWETPFVACLDHRTKSIVVAVRGSLSMRDAITDLCIREDAFQLEDQLDLAQHMEPGEHGIHVHKGMFWSARYIYSKLENEKILDDLFVLQPDYDLVVTGHSLGAGVAALLAMLLKPKYTDVRCFAFSPPGCVISENAVPFTQKFICSVIVGDDLVPRLSMLSMERFKSNILEVIEHCELPKWEILLKGCFKLFCTRRISPMVNEGSDYGSRDTRDLEATPSNGLVRSHPANGFTDFVDVAQDEPLIVGRNRSVQCYTEERDVRQSNNEQHGCTTRSRKLLCPGRIMHVTPNSNNLAVSTVPVNSTGGIVSWREHNYFCEIWLSSSMINDHLPYFVASVLKEAAKASISPSLSSL